MRPPARTASGSKTAPSLPLHEYRLRRHGWNVANGGVQPRPLRLVAGYVRFQAVAKLILTAETGAKPPIIDHQYFCAVAADSATVPCVG